MKDVIFCSLPYSNLDHVYSAPAILKGVVTHQGFTAKTVDFGCELYKLCGNDANKLAVVQNYFLGPHAADDPIIDAFYQRIIDYLVSDPARFLGISVLSIFTQRAVFETVTLVRQHLPQLKIIIGGRGAETPTYKVLHELYEIKGTERLQSFGEMLLSRGLVDNFVTGDGEQAICQCLGAVPLLNTETEIDEWHHPSPDYDDYDFDNYLFDRTNIPWPITASKGCVRDCDFCDVNKVFGKYRYRSGKSVAQEMIDLKEKFGIKKFHFTDSLVNGGLKPFVEFLEILSAYNNHNPDDKITWAGAYICRPENQVTEHLYKLIATAGGEGLTIGAESGSDRVLRAMNKKTTVQSLFVELEHFRQYSITCVLLLMVGHWSETQEDFDEHCNMLVRLLPYVRSGTISAVRLGLPMGIIQGTPAYQFASQNGIIQSRFNPEFVWACTNNPDNTIRTRIQRWLKTYDLARRFSIPLIGIKEDMETITNIINKNIVDINQFYRDVSPVLRKPEVHCEQAN